MSSSPPSERQRLRRALIARRETLDAATHARLSAAVCAHLRDLLARLAPASLGFCWPYRREVDILPLVTDWLQGDPTRRAALPVVGTTDAPLRFRCWSPGDTLTTDRYGIPTPMQGAWLQPELLLIPVNGFDARGYRLGYGGGYFDRTLAELKPARGTIGVGFELARLTTLPEEAHDHPLDWIVTEKGAFHEGGYP